VTDWHPDWAPPSVVLLVVPEGAEGGRLKAYLESGSRSVVWVHSSEAAVNVLDGTPVDAVITVLRAPRIRGLSVVDLARRRNPEAGAILLIQPQERERATRALRRGVLDFQVPPVNLEKVASVVERLALHQHLVAEHSRLIQRLDRKLGFPNLIGSSAATVQLRARLREIAPLETRVLILGEEGCGKHLVASIIHQNSPRRNAPFVLLDCRALAPRPLARVLFGRPARRGGRRQPGRLELAAEGTLFLDGVEHLPRELQARVAEALRTGQLRPEIGALPVEIDPRLIAASDTDPRGAVEAGRFDEGFYQLLRPAQIQLTPLRHRRRDIAQIARHLLIEVGEDVGRTLSFHRTALDRLADHDWPGNVRELKQVVREAAGQAGADGVIRSAHLPRDIRESRLQEGVVRLPFGTRLEEAERELLQETLRLCEGNREKAAAILGIGVRTLYRKLRSYREGAPNGGE